MKAILLLSGGIDSPVAGHLMEKKGLELIPVNLNNAPYSDRDAKERVMAVAKAMSLKKMYIVPHGYNQKEFMEKCEMKYICVLCRRMMFRVASALAKRFGAEVIITGESLAQVASQTLPNIYTTAQAADVPILRPLIGMDKNEIIEIARGIGTFDISIRQAICCTHVPDKPSTAADLNKILEMEKSLDINKLLKESIDRMKEVKL